MTMMTEKPCSKQADYEFLTEKPCCYPNVIRAILAKSKDSPRCLPLLQ